MFIIDWITTNWDIALAMFFLAEKIVKITPTKYDDILVDMIWGGLKKLTGNK
jgi:hypothetical protein